MLATYEALNTWKYLQYNRAVITWKCLQVTEADTKWTSILFSNISSCISLVQTVAWLNPYSICE